MVNQAPISIEALKLRLISSQALPGPDPLLTKDGIHYLLKAVAYADTAFSAEIENVLVKAGRLAVSELVKALSAEHINVRSVAAMSLIRIGESAEAALLKAYPRHNKRNANRWVFDFVLQELGLPVPMVASAPSSVATVFEQVG